MEALPLDNQQPVNETQDTTSDYLQKNTELHPLVQYIYEKFEKAKSYKTKIEPKLIQSLYYYKNQYTPEKLKQIREIGGSEIFVPLTNIKVRSLNAWLVDIFFSDTGEPPFDLEPTPMPELSQIVEEQIKQDLQERYSSLFQQLMVLSQYNPQIIQDIASKLKSEFENLKNEYLREIQEHARKKTEIEKNRINDQFIEGGFYEALKEILLDIALFPTAIMKISVPTSVKKFNRNREVENKVIPTFYRVSPFDIFPSPYVSDFSDYVIEILHLTPQQLSQLKDAPNFNSDAIDYVLSLYSDTGYRVYTNSLSERLSLENKSQSVGLIDVIEFWGSVKGDLLKDYLKGLDENSYYEVAVLICDNYVLKAMINPHPLGLKPYAKASFVQVPDSFWGLSLVDVLKDIQDGVNSLSRAIINNSALSSGPMIERNIDRIPPDAPRTILPWSIFDSTDLGMTGAPAYRFYQPNLTANALVQVLMYYLNLASELSGIPAYFHTTSAGSGAGRTASGLNMLLETSSKGIKEIVKNIDDGIIKKAVEYQYYYNMINYYGDIDEMPDVSIVAKGTSYLANKLAQSQKLIQLLQMTNNPVDLQLLGMENRKYLLNSVINSFGISLPQDEELTEAIQQLTQQLSQQPQNGHVSTGNEYQSQATEMSAQLRQQNPPLNSFENTGGY